MSPAPAFKRFQSRKFCYFLSLLVPINYSLGFVTTFPSRQSVSFLKNPLHSFTFPLSRRKCRCSPFSLTSAAASADTNESDDNDMKTNYHWTSQNFDIALPALIGMLADPLLSLMDTAYVGRVGATELAALGACTSIFHLAFNAFRATTTATTSLVGNASTEDEKRKIIKISLSLGVVLGVIVMTVLEISGSWCLATMGVPGKSPLFAPAKSYLKTRLWAAPAVLGIVVAEGAFRGYGT